MKFQGAKRPELHGVRGLAILMVLVGHGVAGPVAAAGVTLFFALSGYLITSLLMREYARTGQLRIGRFYARRFTRLAPPLVFVVAVIAIVNQGLSWDAWVAPLTWTANYFRLDGYEVYLFGHTWSLAVEEQFYLAWPLMFVALMRARSPIGPLAAMVAALITWRFVLGATDHLVYAYHAAETAGSTILLGCLVAFSGWRVTSNLAVSFAALGMVAVAVACRGSDTLGLLPYTNLTAWIPFLVTPLAAVVVAGAPASPWLSYRWLVFCGVASYSLYLWHEPVSYIVSGGWTAWGVALGALAGLGAYYVLERPLMNWRAASASGDLVKPKA